MLDWTIATTPQGALDWFNNSIRKGVETNAFGTKTVFSAIVLQDAYPLSEGAVDQANTPGQGQGRKAKRGSVWGMNSRFAFKARILGKPTPHAFLPNPCNIQYAKNIVQSAMYISMHTTFISQVGYTTDAAKRPKTGDIVQIRLNTSEFGFDLQYGDFIKILDAYSEARTAKDSNAPPEITCQDLVEAFRSADGITFGGGEADEGIVYQESPRVPLYNRDTFMYKGVIYRAEPFETAGENGKNLYRSAKTDAQTNGTPYDKNWETTDSGRQWIGRNIYGPVLAMHGAGAEAVAETLWSVDELISWLGNSEGETKEKYWSSWFFGAVNGPKEMKRPGYDEVSQGNISKWVKAKKYEADGPWDYAYMAGKAQQTLWTTLLTGDGAGSDTWKESNANSSEQVYMLFPADRSIPVHKGDWLMNIRGPGKGEASGFKSYDDLPPKSYNAAGSWLPAHMAVVADDPWEIRGTQAGNAADGTMTTNVNVYGGNEGGRIGKSTVTLALTINDIPAAIPSGTPGKVPANHLTYVKGGQTGVVGVWKRVKVMGSGAAQGVTKTAASIQAYANLTG